MHKTITHSLIKNEVQMASKTSWTFVLRVWLSFNAVISILVKRFFICTNRPRSWQLHNWQGSEFITVETTLLSKKPHIIFILILGYDHYWLESWIGGCRYSQCLHSGNSHCMVLNVLYVLLRGQVKSPWVVDWSNRYSTKKRQLVEKLLVYQLFVEWSCLCLFQEISTHCS